MLLAKAAVACSSSISQSDDAIRETYNSIARGFDKHKELKDQTQHEFVSKVEKVLRLLDDDIFDTRRRGILISLAMKVFSDAQTHFRTFLGQGHKTEVDGLWDKFVNIGAAAKIWERLGIANASLNLAVKAAGPAVVGEASSSEAATQSKLPSSSSP